MQRLENGVLIDLTPEEIEDLSTPPPLPAEIPMWKARKALRITGWWEPLMAAIAAVENPISRGCIEDELATAPNLVLAGETTIAMKNAMGMSDAELEAVARLALTLP